MAAVNFNVPKAKGTTEQQLQQLERTMAEWAQTLNYAFTSLEISNFTPTDQAKILNKGGDK